MHKNIKPFVCFLGILGLCLPGIRPSWAAVGADYVAVPPFISSGAPPLVMLVMGRDHKLYYEAYNDASDLNEDGILDIRYTPSIDYYGYFDSYKCYVYNSAATQPRFDPVSETDDKTCSGAGQWSGDFLNYLTMSRMDTMRKVLYGGYRSTDTTTETVLQRVFIPQDAHSWGKEYTSVAIDGYDIADYTPFTAPPTGSGLRHLFASTTLVGSSSPPLLRYALNNPNRIWQWVAKESPVADNSIQVTGGTFPAHPNNHDQFETLVMNYAHAGNLFGEGPWLDYTTRNQQSQRYPSPNSTDFGAIDGAGNPFGNDYNPYDANDADQERYLAIFTGLLEISAAGTYYFGVDGDDAVEVIIDGGTPNERVIGYYGAHGADGTSGGIPTHVGSVDFEANSTHTIEFRMEEATGGDRYYLYWNGPDSGNAWQITPAQKFSDLRVATYRLRPQESLIVDRHVRVKVCDPSIGLEANCKQYPNGQYKPIGLLQRHGESNRMYFGLMTGSYAKNTSAGVLRKNIGEISDEIIANTGQFNTSTNGIIQTINKLRIFGYDYSVHNYNLNCGWITSGPMTEGQCRDWGNPIGEMMYESLRYFAGKAAPTTAFNIATSGNDDSTLGLPRPAWNDPYDPDTGFDYCAQPYMLVLSDINPSFDTDQLPGINAHFGSGITTDLSGLNVSTLADEISTAEGLSGDKYIGQSEATFDGICSEKDVTSLGSIRGLCPEEPTKRGGYYSAAVAYYGRTTDLQPSVEEDQKVTTYSVALASPLPRIELRVGPDERPITLVPFGKTISENGYSNSSTNDLWPYQPANTIVDFFVETLTPSYGRFRINFEDVEQGADHDMDAIVTYEYQLIDGDGNDVSDPLLASQVRVTLTSIYASGSYIQHLGFIISGTTNDGPHLVVRDLDTLTYPSRIPASVRLPQSDTLIFSPSEDDNASAAELLKDPLWYAAKWGGYEEIDGIDGPTSQQEWDSTNNGTPDTYFFVTNPLRLEEQLNRSFADILNRASSGTAASVISNTRSGEGAIYQSIFYPEKTDTTANANTVSWVGQIHSFMVDSYGNMREDTNPNKKLDVIGPDLDNNGRVYHEDVNMNCTLDTVEINGITITEDSNGNGVLDTEYASCVTSSNPASDAFLSQLDAIIVFNNGSFDRYYDVNGNGVLDPQERQFNVATSVSNENVRFLWNSSDWLNTISDADIITQRSVFNSDAASRFIFTWVDGNRNGIVDDTEIKDFVWPSIAAPSLATFDVTIANTSEFYSYLHLYPSFADRPTAINTLAADEDLFKQFLLAQTEREINWIRGYDYVDLNGSPTPLNLNGSDIPGTEMRARRFEGETWRLGDIAYSTPTAVGAPAEAYHLLYKDPSYQQFYRTYQKRRNVIYAGANDGMLHAFNGGFYDSFQKQFCRELDPTYNPIDPTSTNRDTPCISDAATDQPELGAELWAYVPYNLLPHLYWLTEVNYNHIYFVDHKPRIFDAKIFTPDDVHVNGWGTIMVVGMRLGGASIQADIDKLDGPSPTADDPTMKSAFIIFDITDPEQKPTLLAELIMPDMGFSTSYPTMVVMKDGNGDMTFGDYNNTNPAFGENRWFLAFGSGPADANGEPVNTLLNVVDSEQRGNFYMVDMVKLGTYNELWSLNANGVLVHDLLPYFTLPDTEPDSFISDPITVDFDLDYNADVLYYGTVSGSLGDGYGGVLRRIVFDDIADPELWVADSIVIDAERPITAAPTAAVDGTGRNWVFFGTGRYFTTSDALDLSVQSYYGIKEPIDGNGSKLWWDVDRTNDLIDTTNFQIFTDANRTVSMGGLASSWQQVINQQRLKSGWVLDFLSDSGAPEGERNLGQATLLGGVLSFTTFIPSSNICIAGGESYLWGLYYETGTAFYESIFGTREMVFEGETHNMSLRKLSLGEGLATTPNLHVGGADGSTAFVQTSTGDIIRVEQDTPLPTKSGRASWKQRESNQP